MAVSHQAGQARLVKAARQLIFQKKKKNTRKANNIRINLIFLSNHACKKPNSPL